MKKDQKVYEIGKDTATEVVKSNPKRVNKVKGFFKAILIFPLLFEYLKEIARQLRKVNVFLKIYTSQHLDGHFNNLAAQSTHLKKMLEKIESKSHHTTFYFNGEGTAFSLVHDRWTVEPDEGNRAEMNAGKLVFFFRYGQTGKIIDKFKLDFNNVKDEHPDKQLANYVVECLKERKINFDQLRFDIMRVLVEGITEQHSLFHYMIVNLLTQSVLENVRAKFEEKLEKEKAEIKLVN